jgi:Ca2+-binding RTX toxin-like protein
MATSATSKAATTDKVLTVSGLSGSDTFQFTSYPYTPLFVDGGTDDGEISDAVVQYSGSTLTAQIQYNSIDIAYIGVSMDLSAFPIQFARIEEFQLADGVALTLSSTQFQAAMDSLAYQTNGITLNPGLVVQGTPGGQAEKLNITVAQGADFQLDDASTAYLFQGVEAAIQFTGGNAAYEGTAAGEMILGSADTEYVVPHLGDDTVYASAGNDLLMGNEGADKLYGEQGNDIFLITRLATSANGGTFPLDKASDGTAELVDGDLMDGGNGIDELRITASGNLITPIEDTVTLTPDNFLNIEKVTIGTNALLDSSLYATVQDQMAAGALTAITTGTDAINVNGATLKTAVTYTGNNGNNMLVGGSAADIFHGNGGNDTLIGGAGADKFYFDSALNAAGNVDTIGDFTAGMDKLVLSRTVFSDLPRKLSANMLVLGSTAVDANDYLIFDAGRLYYDADGSGPAKATLFAQLTGTPALAISDFILA